MRKTWWIAIGPGIFVFSVGAFVIALFLVKLLWVWTIPDLFPGAVQQGLIVRSLSWFTSLKVAIFLAVLTGLSSAHRGRQS